MRYRINLCYDGGPFHGWQVQPGEVSVQGTLQDALETLLREPCPVVGAGRTDTGVNASFYTAHFDAAPGIDCAGLAKRLNGILPASIAVSGIEAVCDDFHARFSARRREYVYYLNRTKDPFASHSYFYGYPEVDFDAMNRSAAYLLGTHDFSCFEKTGGDNKTSICTIYEAGWHKSDENHWYFRIAADRFLRNMVRAIVGTLLEVGRGKRAEDSVAALVASGTRCDAGESVPGEALFLSDIEY